jgi:mono/diheme cytochrome c family protein
MPRPFVSVALVFTLLALIPLGLLVKARVTDSPLPRFMVVFDMDNQDKVKTQKASPLFADGRGMRTPPPGTVAYDEVVGEPALTTGKLDGEWVADFPLPVDAALLQRGRERFDIFCESCHGLSGRGDGITHQRAMVLGEGTWSPPADLTAQPIVDRPVGHIYNTISRGINRMPALGAQIPVTDRWAIVGYVRALQFSRGAALPSDLLAEDRASLGQTAD